MAENFFNEPAQPKSPRKRKQAINGTRDPRKINWLPGQEWREDLAISDNGKVMRTLSNVLIALRQAPLWRNLFAWNQFSSRLMITRELPGVAEKRKIPRELTEPDVSNVTDWMQHNGIIVASQTTAEAIRAVAEDNARHPVRDYLSGLVWDKKKRLDTWLIEHLGVEDTRLHRVFGARWMIGLVARIFEPGCQLDTALILESRQGLKKSTALRVLAEPWFTDHVPDLGNKDALAQLQGVWIIELAELTSFSKAETHRVKAFLSTRVDRFRPSFGRFPADHPRQCGFAGTINPGSNGYLRDETGGRRFWIVACGETWKPRQQVDVTKLRAARDQLWAEAVARYRSQDAWWLDNHGLESEQETAAEARQMDDPRERRIRGYLKGRDWVRMDQILGEECLDIAVERWTVSLRTEIGFVMSALKWRRVRVRPKDENNHSEFPLEWRYFPPEKSDKSQEIQKPEIIDIEGDIPFS